MRKKIVILGSTGSIGKSTLDVIKKNKKSFEVVLLSANNNYKRLIQQAKQFKAKKVLIKNEKFYKSVREGLKNFIHATTHSSSLREKLKKCKKPENILELATSYGFPITIQDLTEDKEAERIANWFKLSEISPLKKG